MMPDRSSTLQRAVGTSVYRATQAQWWCPDSQMAALFFLSFRALSGCNHTETCAGCIVSLTTLVNSSLKTSRSVSSRSLAEKASRSCCIVLAAVEAPVYERLDALTEGVEQRCYHEGGDHDGQLRLLLMACECTEECLNSTYTPEVEQSQHHCE